MKLLVLTGTIPVMYRQFTYNIPIEIRIVENYPMSPPIVLVIPAATMILASQIPYLSSNGYVTVPILVNWTHQNTLFDLVAVLQEVFGNNPPVRARAATASPSPPPPPYAQRYDSKNILF